MSIPGRVCLVTRIPGVAGPASFQRRLAEGLAQRGIEVSYSLDDPPYDVILLIGGTRQLGKLRRARAQGIPIVQRLNGMNWIHRQRKTGWKHFLRAELNNAILRLVRSRYAHHIVYQSDFSQIWWEREHGEAVVRSTVIHNGTPLDQYAPQTGDPAGFETERILVVEGNFSGGYEIGLDSAVALALGLAEIRQKKVELIVAGKVPEAVRVEWDQAEGVAIEWLGLVAPEEIPALDRSAHLLYAADINPACPNTVIEALACGLPVVAFDTGALPELVKGDAGKIVEYGGDPWKLEAPDVDTLVKDAAIVLDQQKHFRSAARAHAEDALGVDQMIDAYLAVFDDLLPE
jgi:glycosyltransferase involved in cell wall biosynthesis